MCERHFFSMNLSSSDDDDNSNDTNSNNKLLNKSKLSSKEKQIYLIKDQYRPLRGDIRQTYEIFDGYQW